MRIIITLIGILMTGNAMAEPVIYSIPWFMLSENNATRQKRIKDCRDDYSMYENPVDRAICNNAEAAESRLYARRRAIGVDQVNTLDWWKDNRDTRSAALLACRRRSPMDQSFLPYCDLAREAERLMGSRIRS